jgi:hypothetical protein
LGLNKAQKLFLFSTLFICVFAGIWRFLEERLNPSWIELYILETVRFYPPLAAIMVTLICNAVWPTFFGRVYWKTILMAFLMNLLICAAISAFGGGWFGISDSWNIGLSHLIALLAIPSGVRFIYNRLENTSPSAAGGRGDGTVGG